MPRRIDTTFASRREQGHACFIAYICACDPDFDTSLKIAEALIAAGADILELGVPFSDPLADGIVNQMAAQRALDSGAHTSDVLSLIREIRKQSEIPIVLFTYLNPVYAYGFQKFHTDAAEAGADGALILDLPPDEAEQNEELRQAAGLEQIHLIAPTTPPGRVAEIASKSEGFIYYVSRAGVTGARSELPADIREHVDVIRNASRVPVAVGFGISTPAQAATVAGLADGVVVGSAIVKMVETHADEPDLPQKVLDFVKPLVAAVKSV